MGVVPIDLGMAAGDHGLLHIHPFDKQLSDRSEVVVDGDAVQIDRPTDQHSL